MLLQIGLPLNHDLPTSMVISRNSTPVTSISKGCETFLTEVGKMENARRDKAEVLEEHIQQFNTEQCE
jgi:hypothetical protein